ncbi:MAG: 50S ribosomal protein L9 [Clostridiales bacterium]|jgi:large subunit ribosomal protein L9|nr:50S ribosomal protein L9 [Clostridiales bacterium]
MGSDSIKVILLEDVKGVGKKDQILNASDGHARNYLIPRKLAVEATPQYLRSLEEKKKSALHKATADLEAAQLLANQLAETKVKIRGKAGKNGTLFGAITSKEISVALSEHTGISIDKKKISLREPIKTLGDKIIEIKLHAQVTAKIVVEVVGLED